MPSPDFTVGPDFFFECQVPGLLCDDGRSKSGKGPMPEIRASWSTVKAAGVFTAAFNARKGVALVVMIESPEEELWELLTCHRSASQMH